MQINVTQQHIDNGQRHCPHTCAVADAIKDALKVDRVTVATYFVLVGMGDKGWSERISLPENVSRFIRRVDQNESVKPFSFDLDVETMKLWGADSEMESDEQKRR